MKTLEEVQAPLTEEAFDRDYLRRKRPVLIRGLASHWGALRKWSPGYLADCAASLGDLPVTVRSTPEAMATMDLSRIDRGRTSLVALLRECERSPDVGAELYVPGLPLGNALFEEDHGPLNVLASSNVFSTTLFFGRNTKGIGHYHPKSHALLCQVQGVKQIRMYPPEDLGRLSPFPAWSPSFFRSRINFYGDMSGFPKALKARSWLCELHPGDALFIPLHWLHVAEGKGWSASVTNWWRPRLLEWSPNLTTARALIGVGCMAARMRLAALSPSGSN